ncbi:beta-mannosidase [Hetaerina americana]|uniref:beta-mannosidase n=1 Tax=Hetaerina americana TaxID=62018 RepID=UPI003A7F61BA
MIFYYVIIALIGYGKALQYLSLNSDDEGIWVVYNSNKSISVSAKVPGGIYSDLISAHILGEDVYYKSNDEDYRWVAYDNWTYQRNFTVPSDWISGNKEAVIFHGIDTVADISLNGVQIASELDNMFVRHVLNVKGILQYGGSPNQLQVHFHSPVKTVQERSRLWPRVVPDCVPNSYHGECHANLIRKTQSSFAWDWGPAFPSSGIWQNVELVTYNVAILRDVTVRTEKTGHYVNNWRIWRATFVLHLEAVAPNATVEGISQVDLHIGAAPGGMIMGKKIVTPTATNEDGELQVEISLEVSERLISLWWPNGMGSQTLYQAIVSFRSTTPGFPEESTVKNINVGFRTVELDETQVGKNGLTFLLRFNGGAMFSKGSNWIPPHALPEMTSAVNGKEMTRDLLLSAREVGVNMLRVWGGGNYESDYFYDLADQMGILIWQDMMFACSMYPTEISFLDSVHLEVKQQVRRLQHHPSVVIWAGNNENEAALRQNWYGTGTNFSSYVDDYALLYNMINTTVLGEDPGSIFLFSSPSNGAATRDVTGPVADDPQSRYYGDVHYYNYLADGWNPSIYPQCRFASEYGFQSLPSMETLKTSGPTSDDWGINKDFFKRRQHHTGGYQEMIIQIQRHMKMPHDTESEEGMSKLVYLTQVNQAMSLKTETEAYRRGMAVLEETDGGEILGATMGALYWQLDDIWQAPSWATLEYGGRWKMAHYYAAKFFSNLMVSPWLMAYNELKVYLLSTRSTEQSKVLDCQLTIKVYHWSDPCSVNRQIIDSQLLPLYGVQAFNADLETYLKASGCSGSDFNSLKSSCFLIFDLKFNDSAYESPSNFLLIDSPKNAAGLKKANVTISSVGEPYSTLDAALKEHYPFSAQINISSDGVALFVWLEADRVKGRFSDNGFLLIADDDDQICQRNKSAKEELCNRSGNSLDHAECFEPGNSIPNLSSETTNQHIASSVKLFTHTLTFYFREKPVNSSILRQTLTVTHLLE